MKLPCSKWSLQGGLFLLVAFGVFVVVQISLTAWDTLSTRSLLAAICRNVVVDLQTGAVREALDYVNSSLRLTKHDRGRWISLLEGGIVSEVGVAGNEMSIYECRPTGRIETALKIGVSRRPLTEHWPLIFLISAFLSGVLIWLVRWIQGFTERITVELIESEISQIFGMSFLKSKPVLARIINPSKSEISQRARGMLKELKANVDAQAEQIKQQSVRAALGDLVSHVAHDMRSPLSLLSVVIRKENTPESSELITKAIGRLNHLADEVLSTRRDLLARSNGTCELSGTIRETLKQIRCVKDGQIHFLPKFETWINARPEALSRVVTILVENGLEACCGDRASVTVSTERSPTRETIRLVVEDNGPGFNASILNLPPELWNTTKVNGNGLGLRFVKDWVSETGGEMFLINGDFRGARVVLEWPEKGSFMSAEKGRVIDLSF